MVRRESPISRGGSKLRGIATALAVGLAIPACSEAWRPVPVAGRTVQGKVHLGAIPLSGGWIEFRPGPHTAGDFATAIIQADGRFVARDVPVGEHEIELVDPQVRGPLRLRPPRRLPPFRVDPRHVNVLDLDLAGPWPRRL